MAGCGKAEVPAASRPTASHAAPAAPAPPPTAPPRRADRSGELRAAAAPVLSAPVPEGFVREEIPEIPGRAVAPLANLFGDVPVQAVVEFYGRHLDPGIPRVEGGVPARLDGTGENVPCLVTATRLRPGCTGDLARCEERVCLERSTGGYVFDRQRPLPPGDPAAVVTVRIIRAGARTRVTIDNISIRERLAEHVAPGEFPERPDLTRYERLEDIPREFIE